MANEKLKIKTKGWYGWQMCPGYGEGYSPYFSPILVQDVIPRKTGRGILTLVFVNKLYAEGVQDFALDLRVLKHESNYLVCEILYEDQSIRDRTAIVSVMTFDWIENVCPHLWSTHPPSSFGRVEQEDVSQYLNALDRL